VNAQRERRRFGGSSAPPVGIRGPATAAGAAAVERVVRDALAEDIGSGDLTSEGLIAPQLRCEGVIVVKQAGIVCGLEIARRVFTALDPDAAFELLVADGTALRDVPCDVARIAARARAVLSAERTALNLLSRLSGIATLTAAFVDAVAGSGVRILDTRKTTPGLRALERYAVVCGGGTNHRAGLYDAILVKENHLRLAGGISAALASLGAREGTPVEVETETLAEVEEALDAGATRILLDNMSPAQVREAVELVDGRVELEASGGITLANVPAYAQTGVQFISVGALTHSAVALDVSLEVA
jgi:nicotinate-nucleotide pyrophosphorylase (carboxylating)